MNNPSPYQSSDTKLVTNITKARNGEYRAIYCYEQLANQTLDPQMKNRILETRNDEIRHFQSFAHIYMSLTGQQPTPKITTQCLADYRQGVHAAFIDEQETVDFYHLIARSTNNHLIKDTFTQASADEQNHAV